MVNAILELTKHIKTPTSIIQEITTVAKAKQEIITKQKDKLEKKQLQTNIKEYRK